MFEDMIAQLDSMGVQYTEDYDAGTLTIDVAPLEKDTLISVISMLTDMGTPFTIDATSITVTASPSVEEATPEVADDMQDEALNQALGMM